MSNKKKIPYPRNLIADAYEYCTDEQIVSMIQDGMTEDQIKGVEYVLDDIGGRYTEMLRMYYKDGMTLQAIGDVNGLTRERIRSIIQVGLRKVRNPMRFAYIKEGYDRRTARLAEMEKIFVREDGKPTMDSDFYELALSVRSYNILRRAGIKTIRQVDALTREDLMGFQNCGVKCTDEILDKVDEFKRWLSA